jgi:hypothetical protein
MKRFYFLKYLGQVFALEPKTRTLLQASPAGAGAPRLTIATLDTLAIPPGRRHTRKAAIWELTPLRLLIEYELNKKRKIGEPLEVVYPYVTPLPKPLVAFLSREEWTEQNQKDWDQYQRNKDNKKKKQQRDRNRHPHHRVVKLSSQQASSALEGYTTVLDEETE